MLSEKPRSTRKVALIVSIIVSMVAFAGFAWASAGLIQNRQVSLQQAQALAKNVSSDEAFPIAVNDLVLKELNRFIGTPDGRDFMKQSLSRMQTYRSLVEKKLDARGVPRVLEAIPIVESGYQNLQQSDHKSWGAGLWMFIKKTAVNYGLEVDDSLDQRTDAPLETDAAMRYLVANDARFSDWELAVLAYNAGEEVVQKGIDETGSRDAWVLVRRGLDRGESYYLPRLMAAILIMQNPSVLE